MKLFFAAPLRALPFLSTALEAQASRLHFWTKLFLAAPTSALPFLSTALLSQVCASAEPIPRAVTVRTSKSLRMASSCSAILTDDGAIRLRVGRLAISRRPKRERPSDVDVLRQD